MMVVTGIRVFLLPPEIRHFKATPDSGLRPQCPCRSLRNSHQMSPALPEGQQVGLGQSHSWAFRVGWNEIFLLVSGCAQDKGQGPTQVTLLISGVQGSAGCVALWT